MAPKSINRLDVAKVPSTVLSKALPLSESANKIALRLLKGHDKSIPATHQVLAEVSGNSSVQKTENVVDQFAFRGYAKQYWLAHTKWISPTSTELRQMWRKLLDEAEWRDTLTGTPWTFEDWRLLASDVVIWTLEEEHYEMAQYILAFGNTTAAVKIIGNATFGESPRLMEIITSASVTRDQETLIALASAARDGQLPVVERYLESRLKSNALSVALVAAARGGHTMVVERLLWELEMCEMGVHHYEDDYMIALQVAARFGHKAVVERLLQKSTIDNTGIARRIVLEAAAAAHQSTVVERMLQKGGEVNLGKSPGLRSPFVSAAEQGHLDIAEQIIRHRGYVSTTDSRSLYRKLIRHPFWETR